jgi:hypothetical protein
LTLAGTGCSASPGTGTPAGATGSANVPGSVAQVLEDLRESHWQEGDAAYDDAEEVALGDGPVGIGQAGAYRLTGTLAEGQVTVDVRETGLVRLILDGANITSADSAAIDVEAADEVVVILAPGSENSLTGAAVYADPDGEPDAALFSKADLTIAGEGKLTVTGRAGDAIASKDGLVVAGGEIDVHAADDALRGRDYVRLAGGRLSIEAGGDGVKSTNDEDPGRGYVLFEGGAAVIEAGVDCVDAATDALISAGSAELTCGDDAVHAAGRLVVDGGAVSVAECYEGLEAPVVVVAGGEIDITARDDAVNAAAAREEAAEDAWDGTGRGGTARGGGPRSAVEDGVALAVTGGTLTLRAGGDGVDSNGTGVLAGGTVTVYAPANGMQGPFDVADSGPVIAGGVVTAYGLAGGGTQIMAPAEESTQGWIAAAPSGGWVAGEAVAVTDQTGKTVATLSPESAVAALVYSAPDIEDGAAYRVAAGAATVEVTAGEAAAGASNPGSGPGRGPGGDRGWRRR